MSARDRILASLEALTKLFTRRLPAAFVWSYRVDSATETSFTGRAVSPDCPFDDVVEIPLTPGIAGAGVKPAVASIALVAFLDGDPAKPRVVGWDQTVPVSVTIDADTQLRLGPSADAVEIAGGGSALHRVNDKGLGGTITAAGPALAYADPNGDNAWSVTALANLGTGVVTFTMVPLTGSPGVLGTKATTGSTKASSG